MYCTYYIPGTMLGSDNIAVNQTNRNRLKNKQTKEILSS